MGKSLGHGARSLPRMAFQTERFGQLVVPLRAQRHSWNVWRAFAWCARPEDRGGSPSWPLYHLARHEFTVHYPPLGP
jgi:hypothetical protein